MLTRIILLKNVKLFQTISVFSSLSMPFLSGIIDYHHYIYAAIVLHTTLSVNLSSRNQNRNVRVSEIINNQAGHLPTMKNEKYFIREIPKTTSLIFPNPIAHPER